MPAATYVRSTMRLCAVVVTGLSQDHYVSCILTSADPTRVPRDWPNREFSRSVAIGSLDWHVQVAGTGPTLELLLGTGSSAHSWAPTLPALAQVATVDAPDLPGHGYTTGAAVVSLTLPRVAAELDALLGALRVGPPIAVVGHSAGAALALRWALDSASGPRTPGLQSVADRAARGVHPRAWTARSDRACLPRRRHRTLGRRPPAARRGARPRSGADSRLVAAASDTGHPS